MTDDHQQTGTGWPQPRRAPRPVPPATPGDTAPEETAPEAAAAPVPGEPGPVEEQPADVVAAPPTEAAQPAPVEEPAADDFIEDDGGFEAAVAGERDAAAAERGTAGDPAPARRRRLSAAGAVIGLLLGLLGFAFVVQLRSNSTDQQLSADRPEDLVRILSDLDARKDRLSQEINTLETTQQQLAAGSQSRQAALAEASRRADELGILAGTLPAQGPGLRVEFRSAAKPIQASDVLDAVEELRGSGAEAMQIVGVNGAVVRIVASSSFVDGSGGSLVVDGTAMAGPYTMTVIGDPQTMQIALNIPNGVVETVHAHGGNLTITSADTVQVSALHQVTNPRYAQPAG
jgi:uncharacterized protein YlxW (UPF0749 family)